MDDGMVTTQEILSAYGNGDTGKEAEEIYCSLWCYSGGPSRVVGDEMTEWDWLVGWLVGCCASVHCDQTTTTTANHQNNKLQSRSLNSWKSPPPDGQYSASRCGGGWNSG